MLKNLEIGVLEYVTVEEFLADLKKEFGQGNDKTIKVVELKNLEQGNRTMEEFIQKFRRVAKESRYEGKPLVKEFKRRMNQMIRRKLIKI